MYGERSVIHLSMTCLNMWRRDAGDGRFGFIWLVVGAWVVHSLSGKERIWHLDGAFSTVCQENDAAKLKHALDKQRQTDRHEEREMNNVPSCCHLLCPFFCACFLYQSLVWRLSWSPKHSGRSPSLTWVCQPKTWLESLTQSRRKSRSVHPFVVSSPPSSAHFFYYLLLF